MEVIFHFDWLQFIYLFFSIFVENWLASIVGSYIDEDIIKLGKTEWYFVWILRVIKWTNWKSFNVDIEADIRSLQLDSAGIILNLSFFFFFCWIFYAIIVGCVCLNLRVFVVLFDWYLLEDNGVVNPEEPKPEEVEATDRMEAGWLNLFWFYICSFFFFVVFVFGSA